MPKTGTRARAAVGHPESSARNLPSPVQSDLDARLSRIQGHVGAIRRMLTAGEDCDDLLVQASAVRSALNGVLVGLMEAHMDSCVLPCARGGRDEEAVSRFRRAMETVLKRS